MPFLDDRRELVASERHSIEVGQAVTALNFFADQAELAEIGLTVVQVTKRHLVNAALQEIAGNA